MPEVSDAALPWVLFAGCLLATVVGGLLAVAAGRYRLGDRIAARLSGMPTTVAQHGCVDCGAGEWQLHRYAGCPDNVRQVERDWAALND